MVVNWFSCTVYILCCLAKLFTAESTALKWQSILQGEEHQSSYLFSFLQRNFNFLTCFYRIRWFVQYVHEETRSQKSFCLPASNFAGKLSQKTWTKKSKKYSLTLLEHYIYMEFATTRKQKVAWMCYKFQNEMKNTNTMKWYEISHITNEAEKSTGGSLTSKTAFCNEVRVQFKLNVKTKLQLRESLSAVFRMNWRKYFEENLMLRISWKIPWPLDRIRRETSPFDFHSVNVEVISLNYWSLSTSTIWLQSFNDKIRFGSKTFLCQGN